MSQRRVSRPQPFPNRGSLRRLTAVAGRGAAAVTMAALTSPWLWNDSSAFAAPSTPTQHGVSTSLDGSARFELGPSVPRTAAVSLATPVRVPVSALVGAFREQVGEARYRVQLLDLWMRDFQSRAGGHPQGMFALDRAQEIGVLNAQLDRALVNLDDKKIADAQEQLSSVLKSSLFAAFVPGAFDSVPAKLAFYRESLERLMALGYLTESHPVAAKLMQEIGEIRIAYDLAEPSYAEAMEQMEARYHDLGLSLLEQNGLRSYEPYPADLSGKRTGPSDVGALLFSGHRLKISRSTYAQGMNGVLGSAAMGQLLRDCAQLQREAEAKFRKGRLTEASLLMARLDVAQPAASDLLRFSGFRQEPATEFGSLAQVRGQLAAAGRTGQLAASSETARQIEWLLQRSEQLWAQGGFYQGPFAAQRLLEQDSLLGLSPQGPSKAMPIHDDSKTKIDERARSIAQYLVSYLIELVSWAILPSAALGIVIGKMGRKKGPIQALRELTEDPLERGRRELGPAAARPPPPL